MLVKTNTAILLRLKTICSDPGLVLDLVWGLIRELIYSHGGIGVQISMMFPATAHPQCKSHDRLTRTGAVSKGFSDCLIIVGHALPKRLCGPMSANFLIKMASCVV